DPNDAAPWIREAWLLLNCPDIRFRDGKKCIDYATKACELNAWKRSGDLDTLAAAYAEVADFESAVKWQTKACDIVSEQEKADYQLRLEFYADRKQKKAAAKK